MPQNVIMIYMSRTTHVFQPQAIQQLAASAARKNAEKEITGLLIKIGNYFLQVLEGPTGSVAELLTMISADTRHREVRVLYREFSDKRLFAQWSMGCVNLDDQYALDLKEFRQLRERVNEIMSAEEIGKDRMMEVIKTFPSLLQRHKAAAPA